jgi:AcrR family transcriptional regulator
VAETARTPTPTAVRRGSARDRVLRAARRSLASGELPPLLAIARDAGVSRSTLYRLVPSRAELLRLLDVEPDPNSRQRVLAEAATLIGEHGLAGLAMDELAVRAGISRASLYRLFPGKPALFREVMLARSPFVLVGRALVLHAGEPPELMMPAVARAGLESVRDGGGLFRALLLEVTGPGADAELGRDLAITETIGPLAAYVAGQMAEGRLRPMDPLLALQAFAGPLVMHLITRSLAERVFGYSPPLERVADELSAGWLRAMQPPAEAA